MKKKEVLYWTIVSFFLLIFILLALKFVNKNFGNKNQFFPYSEMFQHRLPPLNYSIIPNIKIIDHGVEIYSNTNGMRDYEWPLIPEDGFRIAVLGDSQAFGTSVAFEKIWSSLIKKELANQKVKVFVYNIAVPGWNFEDQSIFLREHWNQIKPNLVLNLFLGNDLDSSLTVLKGNHHLEAPYRDYEPFYQYVDAWIMTCFALARKDNPNLEFSSKNAFKEMHRVDFFLNIFLSASTHSGISLFNKYKKDLSEFNDFIKKNSSELYILVHSTFPGSRMEKNLSEIYEELKIPYTILSSWLGDSADFLENWANLPIDIHGGEKYHELIAAISLRNIISNRKILPVKLRQNLIVPKELSLNEIENKKLKIKAQEDLIINSLGNYIDFDEPKTMKQIIAMGYNKSPQIVVFKADKKINAIKFEFDTKYKPLLKNNDKLFSVYLVINGNKFFARTIHDENFIWAEIPENIALNEFVEIGYVVNYQLNGVFVPVFPVKRTELCEKTTDNWSLSAIDYSSLIKFNEGYFSDGWMSKEAKFSLNDNVLKLTENNHFKVTFKIESTGLVNVIPVALRAICNNGHKISELIIKDVKEYKWDLNYSNCSVVKIISDKVFIPREVNKKSEDGRNLSVRILLDDFRKL